MWCNEWNELVHGLISLKLYNKYNEEFKRLAMAGVPLVFELYDACTDFRNRYYEYDAPTDLFPVKNVRAIKGNV